jgi:UPF0755 protein
MKRTPSKFSSVFLIITIGALILACGFAYNFILQYPNQAEMIFGRPSVHMTTWQHYLISYRLVKNQPLLLEPVGIDTDVVDISIELDQPTDSIITELADNGLIFNSTLFRDYLIYAGLDTQLQAGTYRLNKGMSAVEIANTLLDATPLFVKVSILPGWRMEEIAESLPSTGIEITPEEFLQAAHQRYPNLPIMQEVPVGASLEGFFPPGIYEVERTIKAEQLVQFLL